MAKFLALYRSSTSAQEQMASVMPEQAQDGIHLARDGREHAIKLLDALNAPEFQPWTLVTRRGHRKVRTA